jgi:hypothetical protein
VKWLAMLEPSDLAIALYIVLIFVVFVCGLFLGRRFSPSRHKAYEPRHTRLAAAWYARVIAAERSVNLLAFVIAFVVGLVVLDHFMGPLFPEVFSNRIVKSP